METALLVETALLAEVVLITAALLIIVVVFAVETLDADIKVIEKPRQAGFFMPAYLSGNPSCRRFPIPSF